MVRAVRREDVEVVPVQVEGVGAVVEVVDYQVDPGAGGGGVFGAVEEVGERDVGDELVVVPV